MGGITSDATKRSAPPLTIRRPKFLQSFMGTQWA